VRRVSREVLLAIAGGVAALALYLHSLAPTITMANGAGDSGELASTAYTLGIAHPTGYPLYTLLGFVVTHLGGGEPAFSLNVFSAVMGAVTVGLLLLLALHVAWRAVPGAPWPLAAVASGIAVLAFALSTNFWTEAVVTETRTLALALDTLILVLLVVPRPRAGRHVLLAAVLYGLALSDHLLSLYLAPALIVLVLASPATVVAWQTTACDCGRMANDGLRLRSHGKPRPATARGPHVRGGQTTGTAVPRRWLMLLGCCLAGLTCYAYLPLRAAAQPAANWGNPDTVGRFLWVVSGQEYRYQMFGLSPADSAARIGTSLGLLWQQLNGATVLAALIGIAVLLRRQVRLAVALLLTFVIDLVATSNYQADAAPAYLLLGFLCVAVAAAVGWLAMGHGALRALDRIRVRGQVAVGLVCLGGIVACGWPERSAAAAARHAVALSSTTAVRDAGIQVLRSLPRNAVIFAQGDAASVPLWYAQRGLRLRPDVTIVATALLTFSWYYKQMRRLPAFDRRLLPDSDRSIDDGTDFTLIAQRTALLGQAVAAGRQLFVAIPEPALTMVCRQVPYGQIYRCR
jgi:Protein of unknown function (DUF2723)